MRRQALPIGCKRVCFPVCDEAGQTFLAKFEADGGNDADQGFRMAVRECAVSGSRQFPHEVRPADPSFFRQIDRQIVGLQTLDVLAGRLATDAQHLSF